MAKRLTAKEKKEIIKSFTEGNSLDFLSENFNCTKLTIIRNLKKELGEKEYRELNNAKKQKKEKIIIEKDGEDYYFNSKLNNQSPYKNLSVSQNENESDFLHKESFYEISPLVEHEIKDESRKELSSVSISDIDFPNIVYMIVDKKIELEIKLLKDFPDWSFLPKDDLFRKTIEIYLDLKIAKRFCNKDQKVIKVPNTNVFRIAAPILIARGISRIVSADKLIAL